MNNNPRRPQPRQTPTRSLPAGVPPRKPAGPAPVRPFRITTREPQTDPARIHTTVPGPSPRAHRDRVTIALRDLGGTAHNLDDLEAATGLARNDLHKAVHALTAAGYVTSSTTDCRACQRTDVHTQLLPTK